jgi:hypothetical protein
MIPDKEWWWWYNPNPSWPDQDPFPVWVFRSGRGFRFKYNDYDYGPVSKAPGMWKGIVVKYKGGRV